MGSLVNGEKNMAFVQGGKEWFNEDQVTKVSPLDIDKVVVHTVGGGQSQLWGDEGEAFLKGVGIDVYTFFGREHPKATKADKKASATHAETDKA